MRILNRLILIYPLIGCILHLLHGFHTLSVNFKTCYPLLKYFFLNLLSASTVNIRGLSTRIIFRNSLKVRLSPIKSPILSKYSNPFRRHGMYRIVIFPSTMPRDATVVSVYVQILPLHHQLISESFLSSVILNWNESRWT